MTAQRDALVCGLLFKNAINGRRSSMTAPADIFVMSTMPLWVFEYKGSAQSR